MAKRMSEERLNELSRLVDAELTVPSRLVRVALDEIDELKAEVREKDEALQESRRLHADLVKEVDSMASSVFQRRLSNDRRRIENE